MPNYFSLISKKTGKPESFEEIDRKMCVHFGVPVSDTQYYGYWYQLIGLQLALGHPFSHLLEGFRSQPGNKQIVEILLWLQENYQPEAWATR